ncbi:hypothetical protein LCGC14_2183900 [marine sediment metagenome]|uniref:Uncharacterized protein n=1 Tax=marine sediment metagenome TaxID=412755 RepID=A0A0F9DLK7_9ZZZZ
MSFNNPINFNSANELREAGYVPVGIEQNALLTNCGFEPAQPNPIGPRFWYPAHIAGIVTGSFIATQRVAILRAIAADPEFEAALYAVWVGYGRSTADGWHAVSKYIYEALPELFE